MRKVFFFLAVVVLAVVSFISLSLAQVPNHPWAKFNVGSWVNCELTGGMQQKSTLISKNDEEVVVKMEIVSNGAVVSSSDVKMPLKVSAPPSEAKLAQDNTKQTTGDLALKGENLPCKIYETDSPNGKFETWMSDKIPGSVVQTKMGDTVMMKVLDYEAK